MKKQRLRLRVRRRWITTDPGDICRQCVDLALLCAAVRETGKDVLRVEAVEGGD
jgi:hypothetical protein